MTAIALEMSILVDGVEVSLLPSSWDKLTRAVVNSMFTWRRARPDDKLPEGSSSVIGGRMGWWGDSIPTVVNDRFGSRLWLLRRVALSQQTINLAREYAEEALAWLVEDGVCVRVAVTPERVGKSGLLLRVFAYQSDGSVRELTFSDIWGIING